MVHRQRDRVGFAAFDDDIVEYVPPSAKHMETTLHILDRLKPSKPGQLAPPMKKLAEHFARRGLLVLISDLYEDPQAVLEAVAPLRFRGHDMIVFHVLDPAEVEFTYDQASAFEDLESGEQIPVVPEALAEQYRALITRAQRRAAVEVLGAADRLRAHQHRHDARPGALQLPVDARTDVDEIADEIADEDSRMTIVVVDGHRSVLLTCMPIASNRNLRLQSSVGMVGLRSPLVLVGSEPSPSRC